MNEGNEFQSYAYIDRVTEQSVISCQLAGDRLSVMQRDRKPGIMMQKDNKRESAVCVTVTAKEMWNQKGMGFLLAEGKIQSVCHE